MAISRQRKEELIAHYSDLLGRSQAVILTEYRGMNDGEFKKLRRAVREANGAYHVTKLSLLKRALEASGYAVPHGLEGAPIAVGFCFSDVPAVAKALTEHARTSELLVIRGGLMGAQMMSGEEVSAIADLPPLEVLQAQILGLLDAPAGNLVGVIQAGVGQVINVLHAYSEKAA